MKTLLYLEPYTFIFSGIKEKVIYNTINSSYIHIQRDKSPIIYELIEHLENPDNGYCQFLDEEIFQKDEVINFIRTLKQTFSGGISNHSASKPFIMSPICKVYNSTNNLLKEDGSYDGRKILKNLNEVFIYLSKGDKRHIETNKEYPKFLQFPANTYFDVNEMREYELFNLLSALSAIRVPKVTFLNLNTFQKFSQLFNLISNCSFKKVFILSERDNIYHFYKENNIQYIIDIENSYSKEELKNLIKSFPEPNIKFRKSIESKAEFNMYSDLLITYMDKLELIPYYNGYNIKFFSNNIFNSLQDILSNNNKKIDLYRRKILNDYFFGKLFILPNGETYSNLNGKSLGNIINSNLSEIVYKEIVDGKYWFMTRDKVSICSQCVNRVLCPSISNYELVSNINNMCFQNRAYGL